MNETETTEAAPAPEAKRFETVIALLAQIHPRIRKPFLKGRTRPILQFDEDGLPQLVGFRRPASGTDVILSRAFPLSTDHPFVKAAKYRLKLTRTRRGISSQVKGRIDV
jgi:hypothetical protein